MAATKIRLFDNIIIALFFFFLPFSYALTFNIGFPLKISEISLFVLLLLLIAKGRFSLNSIKYTSTSVLLVFFIFTFISMMVNLFYQYDYPLHVYESRFGYKFDSILKYIYVFIAMLTYLIASQVFTDHKKKYAGYFFWGATLATVYLWYLFFSGLLKIPVLSLPGMDTSPQVIGFSGFTFVRCGTFKEGNFMGFFLVVSGIISFYFKRFKKGVFFFASVIPTFSSIAVVCALLFLFLFYFSKYFTKKNIKKLILFLILGMFGFFLLTQNKTFNLFVTSKFIGSTEKISNNSEYSKADRLDLMKVALLIGANNPILGVGISNYALHYKQYGSDKRFKRDFKVIPNNVYAEIFSETGVIGLFLFLYFLFLLLQQASSDKTNVLKYGLIVSMVYLLAFPTYTVLFIWFFFGLITSQYKTRDSSPNEIEESA